MSSAEELAAGLYRAPGNAGPRTRALYEYQDACVALRCIPNLLPDGHVEAVVVEWSTDYILLGRDGRRELVSVKHRDPGQHDWTFGRLKAENVFRDLHAVWRAMGETGDYVFESNAGFEPALRPYMGNPGERAVPDGEAAGKLASYLQADLDEVLRFLPHFFLRGDPLPGRFHIGAVATQDLAVVMEHLGLDSSHTGSCLTALTARIAEVSTQRPPEPSHRVERLTGFMRDIEDHARLTATGSLLTMEELRDVVVTASRSSRQGHGQVAVIADDPLFVGRDSELAQIADLLHPGSEDVVRPVALTGMPGIGKTALAAKFAASYAMRLRIYVLAADTRTALVAGIHSLNPPVTGTELISAQVIGLKPPPPHPSIPDDPALLVIVDGLTDPAVVDGLIARQSRTRVLITATCRHVDDAFTHIPLHGLTSQEGAAYLRQVLPDADTSELEEMLRAFSGHPLGLAQGANYCRNEGLSPREYLARLSLHPAQMLQLGRSPGHPLALGRAIETAFTAASRQDRTAADLAAIMACLAPEPVPTWLFSQAPLVLQRDDEAATADVSFSQAQEEVFGRAAALTDLPTLDRAVAAMHRYGLITRTREGLRMHPLVGTVIRETISGPERSAWIESALGLLLRHTMGPAAAPEQEPLTPHVAACVELAVTATVDPLALCGALSWLGDRHYYFGSLTHARRYHERACSLAEEASLPNEVIFGCLRELARTLRSEGSIDDALAAVDKWMAHATDAGAETALHGAQRMRAHTLVYSHRLREAADAFADLAASRSEEPDDSERIMDLSIRADLERSRGHYERAMALIDEAMQLVSQVESEARRQDHHAALHEQASKILRDLGRNHDALARQRQSLDAARTFGFGVMLADSLYGLAGRLLDSELAEEAEQVIAEGIELARARGTDSPLYGSFLQASGRLALLRGEWEKAEALLTEAVRLAESGGEPALTDLAAACYNLANAYAGQAKLDHAISTLQRARDIDAAVYGDSHPELLVDECTLAQALYADGQLEAARTAINRCLLALRRAGAAGRRWRTKVLTLAIAIDVALGRSSP